MTAPAAARRSSRIGATLVCLLLAVTGCGVPTDAPAQPLPIESVPAELLASRDPSQSGEAARGVGTAVAFVDGNDDLRLRRRDVGSTVPSGIVTDLLTELTAGPDPQEQALDLTSRLPTTTTLRLLALRDGVAVIDCSVVPDRLQAGQIVLTAVSAAAVSAVELRHDGRPVQVAIADGRLSSGPWDTEDFLPLIS